MITHTIHGQRLVLSHLRGLYWEEARTLMVADTHFGKTGHFQKAGIPVPAAVMEHDLLRLADLIYEFHPERLLVLGDLFHSSHNSEWDHFAAWRKQFAELPMVLVRGNHDILHPDHYADLTISVVPEMMQEGPFFLSHKPFENARPLKTVICGHVHPAVTLQGRARQSVKFPCFYFGSSHCILPAFSEFTGSADIEPERHDAIYVVTDRSIHKVS